MNIHHLLLAAGLAAAAVSAQTVSVQFSPNPAPPGTPVTITGTDATGQGLTLPSPCGWVRIYQGSQTGPFVGPLVGCIQVLVPVAPNGSFSLQWDQQDQNGRNVPPGTYWVETRVFDANFNVRTDWFCLSVQGAGVPALTAAGNAVVGQSTALQVNAPNAPAGFWFAAASLSSNNPISVLGLNTCLSTPITGDVFTNPFGQLDAAGQSAGIALNIPNLAPLRYLGLQLQALVVGGPGLQLTNALSFTIQ